MWVLKKKILMGTLIPRNTTRPWRYFKIQTNDILRIFFCSFTGKALFICAMYTHVLKLVIFKYVRIDQCCNSIFFCLLYLSQSFFFLHFLSRKLSIKSFMMKAKRRNHSLMMTI